VLFPSTYRPGDHIILDGAEFAQTMIDSLIIPCSPQAYARLYETYPLWPGAVPLTRAALIDSLNAAHYGVVHHIGTLLLQHVGRGCEFHRGRCS